MRETILRTDFSIDECRSRIANAAVPWPDSGTVAIKSMFAIGQPHRVIIKHSDQCLILALKKFGMVSFPFYRGIGFRLACNLFEETRDSGTRIVCRLDTYLLWRVLACSAFIVVAASASLLGTGRFQPGFWVLALVAVFIGLIMPSFLNDGADLVSFLKKVLKASAVNPE